MAKRWRITYTNGDQEITDSTVDKVHTSPDGSLLYAYVSHNYAPDELIAVYPTVNIRKWEPLRGVSER